MTIYTEAEEYIIECLKNNKNPSNRKISILGKDVDYKKIYNLVYKTKPPKCLICEKDAKFISLKRGYGKLCSKQCHSKYMTRYNQENNATKNAKVKETIQKERQTTLDKIEREYVIDHSIPIEELSKKYDLPSSYVRKYLSDREITDCRRSSKVRKQNLERQFSDINRLLSNSEWVEQKINEGWVSHNFADYFGCSKNYVCSFLRDRGNSLPNNSNSSSYETQLKEFFVEKGINFKQNDRKIIAPLEVDFLLPDYNLAIEINGIYWHNNQRKDKNYHLEKTNSCLNKNLNLLHFYDCEIDHKWDLVKSIINSKLGINDRIYARNCEVVEINSKQYKDFCVENHIQGHVGSSVKLGLVYNDDLVAVMGFGKSRYNKSYQYELLRYCGKRNSNIIGGASKLYRYFTKNYKPRGVISYSQRRLFTGKVYQNIGMTHLKTTPPNYFWVNAKNEVFTRYQTQKHKITEKDDERTESEIMMQRGFYKIYDSGQDVYVDHYKY